jgi:type II secretory pathway predicted ATPase ExeA
VDYLHHFGLNDDPFRNDHHDRFIAETPSQTEARRRIDRGVRQGRGLVLLVGGPGSGKTLVARRLYEELEEEMFEASMMVLLRSRVDSQWLLHRLAAQLGVEEPPTGREALIAQVYERLAIIREDGRHAVLIVDDAQALATPETLAELSALVKLEYEDRRVLTVVLVGSPALEHALHADAHLAHQVEVRVQMPPLAPEEAATYLGHRLSVAGGSSEILLPGAVAALRELSHGAPGLMNGLADNALFEAYLAGRSEVTRNDVESAWRALAWPTGADLAARPAWAAGERSSSHRRSLAETTSPDLDGMGDVDSELDAVFEPGASRSGTSRAAAPASAAATEIELGDPDMLEAPPKDDDDSDAVDELFMELIDD